MERTAGILLPVFSLPSPYGIGTAESGKAFVDFLHDAGQSYWQFLPLCPVGAGNSPYQSYSAFAGNPLFIDPGTLLKKGLITKEEEQRSRVESCKIDYKSLFLGREKLFKGAFKRADKKAVKEFLLNNEEIFDYCLFCAIKDKLKGLPLEKWEEPIKRREAFAVKTAKKELSQEILYYGFLQYEFAEEWSELKEYANEKSVKLIGDIPIYVSADSADFWKRPEQFLTDENGDITHVAGVPPDYFAKDGQLWGNPLYDYSYMERDGFSWWLSRLENELKRCDVLRIDHFRGFADFWAVKKDAKTAKEGEWLKGPGEKLTALLKKKAAGRLIAEDLGDLSNKARSLVKKSGIPGMRVLEFAFDSLAPNDYQPHRYNENCVAYSGTHDNAPTMGWIGEVSEEVRQYAKSYLALNAEEGWHIGIIRALYSSRANLVITPIADLIGMGKDARINTPGTPEGNWEFRLKEEFLTQELKETSKRLVDMYERAPKRFK